MLTECTCAHWELPPLNINAIVLQLLCTILNHQYISQRVYTQKIGACALGPKNVFVIHPHPPDYWGSALSSMEIGIPIHSDSLKCLDSLFFISMSVRQVFLADGMIDLVGFISDINVISCLNFSLLFIDLS